MTTAMHNPVHEKLSVREFPPRGEAAADRRVTKFSAKHSFALVSAHTLVDVRGSGHAPQVRCRAARAE